MSSDLDYFWGRLASGIVWLVASFWFGFCFCLVDSDSESRFRSLIVLVGASLVEAVSGHKKSLRRAGGSRRRLNFRSAATSRRSRTDSSCKSRPTRRRSTLAFVFLWRHGPLCRHKSRLSLQACVNRMPEASVEHYPCPSLILGLPQNLLASIFPHILFLARRTPGKGKIIFAPQGAFSVLYIFFFFLPSLLARRLVLAAKKRNWYSGKKIAAARALPRLAVACPAGY